MSNKRLDVARYKPPKYPPRLRLETIRDIRKKLNIFVHALNLADRILRDKARTCPLCGTSQHIVGTVATARRSAECKSSSARQYMSTKMWSSA